MADTLDRMRTAWERSAKRHIGELWEAIMQMTQDPIEVADRIAEAGQRDHTAAASAEAMDEINSLAIGE